MTIRLNGMGKRLDQAAAGLRDLEKRRYLAGLDAAALVVHVQLADAGLLEEPGPEARARARAFDGETGRRYEAQLARLPEEAAALTAALDDEDDRTLTAALAGDAWEYFHRAGVAASFGTPGAALRLLARLRADLREPDLTAAAAGPLLDQLRERLWRAGYARAAAALGVSVEEARRRLEELLEVPAAP